MASYGPRWQSAPNAAPPFAGAPPIPSGANIPAQQWNAGRWIPTPAFNPQAARPTAPAWMPGQAWGQFYPPQYRPPQQQQQQQQHFNPYKRQPKPPSAEYLATALSDNPLGLTNMIPAEEVERQKREQHQAEQAEAEASTPWFWTPRDLEDDNDDGEKDGPNQDQPAPRNAIYAAPTQHQTPERPPSAQAPESFTSKGVLQPTFSVNIIRTPGHYASPSPSRTPHRSSAPTQIYASPARTPSRGTSVDNITAQMGNMSTKNLARHHSMPVTSSNSTSFTDQQFTEEPTSLNILSPLVLPMTPKTSSARSTQNLGRHASVPAVTTNLDTILESASSPSRTRTPAPGNASRRNSNQEELHYSHSRSRPSSRQASRSSSASTSPYGVSNSGEPSPISPTYLHSSGHSPNHPNFPSHSQPSKNPIPAPPAEVHFPSLSQIPGSSSTTNPNHTSPGTASGSYIYMQPAPTSSKNHTHSRTKSYSSSSQSQAPPQASGTALYHSNGMVTLTPLTSSPPRSPPTASKTLERSLSPAHLYPHQHHLQNQHHQSHHLPDRPSTTIPTSKPKRKSSSNAVPHSNNTSPNASSSSPSGSGSGKSKHQRRRKGYWNRRGDHVTPEGYVVYAPGHLVYPKDLDDYPDGKDGGYQNETGLRTAWAARPEISPKGGYEALVQWTDF